MFILPYRPSKTTTAEPEAIGTERHIIMQRGSSERHSVKTLTVRHSLEFEHTYNLDFFTQLVNSLMLRTYEDTDPDENHSSIQGYACGGGRVSF